MQPHMQCLHENHALTVAQGKVDILLFNPPYVPTEDSEVSMRYCTAYKPCALVCSDNTLLLSGIAAAWAGGRRGRRVINRFLPLLPVSVH
jgi:release factor glutamine methyltransferase